MSVQLADGITMWEVGRALPLLGIALAGLWFVAVDNSPGGFVTTISITATLCVVYGVLTGLEWIALRM